MHHGKEDVWISVLFQKHKPLNSLTHSLTCSLIHSLTHLLTHSHTHSLTLCTDVMKYHYKKTCTKKDLLPYLAIIHVRDMLIPPSERYVLFIMRAYSNSTAHKVQYHELHGRSHSS